MNYYELNLEMTRLKIVGSVSCLWLVILFMLSSLHVVYAKNNKEICVQVIDKNTNEPLVGAVVRSGNFGKVTDSKGKCCLSLGSLKVNEDNTVTLSIAFIGYASIDDQPYKVPQGNETIVIYLEETMERLDEVVVTAQAKGETTRLQQTTALEAVALEKSTSESLAKVLEQVPGVSTISSGGTIAKPVIQGMHSSRILLVNNGVKLESQSWDPDHSPEIDHTGANIVEVIKGAEAVRYGYGAMGGVVIFSQAPLLYGSDGFRYKGGANLGFSSNNLAYDGAGTVELGYKWLGLRLHGMYQKAGDYSTAEYILNNTGFNNISLSGSLGYKGKRLTVNFFSSLYTSRSGIYYASKISDIDQLLARFEAGRPDDDSFNPFSYDIEPPFQQSQHLTMKGEIKYDVSPRHLLSLSMSYQNNLRQEFENRKKRELSWLPMQDLILQSYSGELLWKGFWGVYDMNSQVGISSIYQSNYNVPGTRQPAFIPNFAALTVGGFLIHEATFFGKLTCSGGMRYDFRVIDVKGYSSLSSFKYYGDFKLYSNFTGNLAAYYKITENFDARANIGWSWRPPDVNELYATGLHHGTYWVVGNRDLVSERGYKAIIGGGYHNSWVSVDPSFFYQRVFNYIYDNIGKGSDRFHSHPTGKYPRFVYEQDNVRFLGGDLLVTFVPIRNLSIITSGEWIAARNLTQKAWLPFMPSDRYSLTVEYLIDFGKTKKWHAAASVNGMFVTKQKRFDPNKDLVPETPPAYFLLGASAEIKRDLGKQASMKLMLVGDNILNSLYKEYTDRFRYYAHCRGANYSVRLICSF